MRLAANLRTGKKTLLRSWKSVSDPSIGSFSAGIDPSGIPQFLIWNDSRPIWRTGPWNGHIFIGVPEMFYNYLDGFNLVDDGNGGLTLTLGFANESDITNFVLSSEGKFGQASWNDRAWKEGSWHYEWATAQDECDVYGKCGSFASCDAYNSPICSCLRGFEPKNSDEWNSGNWTNGCVRRNATLCERIQYGGERGKEDGFTKLESVKVPDFAEWSSSITEQNCRDDCLNKCSCIAYAYYSGISCMLWRGNLTDIKQFFREGADLYIRLAYTELDDGNGGFTFSSGFANKSYFTNFVLSSEGKFGQVIWDDRNEGSWDYQWATARDECDVYGKCGSFASCDANSSPICSCLKGFEPKNSDEWNSRNWTNGCVRRNATLCERTQNDGQVLKEDGFSKLERVKVPDFAEWSSSITEQKCRDDCLNNCSCIAYAYYSGIYCMLWRGNLTDIKQFSSGGADLYIRLAYTELDNKKKNLKVIISLTVVGGAIAIAICVFYSWRWIAEYKGKLLISISLVDFLKHSQLSFKTKMKCTSDAYLWI
ncbi:hypothetical protein OIU84_002357 [Salix udensis]|uniref:non-specific serine/threonine protein kinase n=1 Tax=Salix udensis TaxID=889485 RepID=A0AAD6K5X6_9ROSI|nr:hypothetical protein OIU84_002357 [Salix udensis]